MSQTESFRGYLQARGRSEITIDNYAIQIQNYLNSIGDADPFQAETVEGYLTKLGDEKGLKPQSLRWVNYAIRTYFRANHARSYENVFRARARVEGFPVLVHRERATS
jgi:hypothetical protein